MVGRGVFLDVLARREKYLEDGHAITTRARSDREETERPVQAGRFIVVRTGQMGVGKLDAAAGTKLSRRRRAGFAVETLEWIQRTVSQRSPRHLGCEVRPNETEAGINQPGTGHDPMMGMTMGGALLREGARRRLRRRQGVRVSYSSLRRSDHGRGGIPTNPLAHQIGATMAKMTGASASPTCSPATASRHVSWSPPSAQDLRRDGAPQKIKRIHTHGEKSAAYMATASARLGRPGICMAQVIGGLQSRPGCATRISAHSRSSLLRGPRSKYEIPRVLPSRRRAGFRAGVSSTQRS